MKIKIEKDVPPPVAGTKELKPVFARMNVGDSIVIDEQLRQFVPYAARCAGIKCTARAESNGKVRIWRT